MDSLFFANGLARDEANGDLYVAEIVAARVWRFRVDPATGTPGDRHLFADSVAADNLELDQEGNLWIVSPLSGELILANTATGERHTAFRSQTPAQAETMAEFMRRGEAGESRLSLLTPELWAPLPSLITGGDPSPGGRPRLPDDPRRRTDSPALMRGRDGGGTERRAPTPSRGNPSIFEKCGSCGC